jgi:predicted regulator of Ras-like GTPase activity (Roadblock/LC7/MglB family)
MLGSFLGLLDRQMEKRVEDLLQELLYRVEGAHAAAIGNLEGLLVEGVKRRRVDLEAAIAEHAALLRQARAAYASALGSPTLQELWVGASPVVGYARMLGVPPREDLFLLLLMDPEANLGQARLQAGRLGLALLEVTGWLT